MQNIHLKTREMLLVEYMLRSAKLHPCNEVDSSTKMTISFVLDFQDQFSNSWTSFLPVDPDSPRSKAVV